MSTTVIWSKAKLDAEFQYGRHLGEFSGLSFQSHLPHAGCCHLANSMSWSQSYMSHCRVLPPGKFSGMSSQSHISHSRVLPLGEFTVMVPRPHATLQGVVSWRNQCHDHATLQGVRISSALLSCHSRQRERLSASMLSICLSVCLLVCLFVCLLPKCKKHNFLKN